MSRAFLGTSVPLISSSIYKHHGSVAMIMFSIIFIVHFSVQPSSCSVIRLFNISQYLHDKFITHIYLYLFSAVH